MNNYLMAATLAEALEFLDKGNSRVIAGGTDLFIDLNEGKTNSTSFVDISNIKELEQISESEEFLEVGSCCIFSEIEKNPLVLKFAPSLAKAASEVGSPQIRNTGTIGGNIVNAMPAADGATALMGLKAKVEVVSKSGNREVSLEDCYVGIGKSVIDPTREIITKILIPKCGPNRKAVFKRMALRKSLALPVVACSVLLEFNGNIIKDLHVVAAPAGTRPWYDTDIESKAIDKKLSAELLNSICEEAAAKAPFRDSPSRCSAKYKHLLAEALLKDCVADILKEVR